MMGDFSEWYGYYEKQKLPKQKLTLAVLPESHSYSVSVQCIVMFTATAAKVVWCCTTLSLLTSCSRWKTSVLSVHSQYRCLNKHCDDSDAYSRPVTCTLSKVRHSNRIPVCLAFIK